MRSRLHAISGFICGSLFEAKFLIYQIKNQTLLKKSITMWDGPFFRFFHPNFFHLQNLFSPKIRKIYEFVKILQKSDWRHLVRSDLTSQGRRGDVILWRQNLTKLGPVWDFKVSKAMSQGGLGEVIIRRQKLTNVGPIYDFILNSVQQCPREVLGRSLYDVRNWPMLDQYMTLY